MLPAFILNINKIASNTKASWSQTNVAGFGFINQIYNNYVKTDSMYHDKIHFGHLCWVLTTGCIPFKNCNKIFDSDT